MVYSVKRKEREGERRKGVRRRGLSHLLQRAQILKHIKKLLKNTVFNIQPDFGEAG